MPVTGTVQSLLCVTLCVNWLYWLTDDDIYASGGGWSGGTGDMQRGAINTLLPQDRSCH